MRFLKKEIEVLRASGMFDSAWYLSSHLNMTEKSTCPIEHYLTIGAKLSYNPSKYFDTRGYLETYPDVAQAGINPLFHYIVYGKNEGRRIVEPRPLALLKNDTSKKIRGDINRNSGTTPLIRGWLAEIGNNEPRNALLIFDKNYEIEIKASIFRDDLKKNLINEGYHAFEVPVPQAYIDGKPHYVELVDGASKIILAKCNMTWQHSRRFKDFSGFLANSFVMPVISTPFREEDKRCFAAMENVARSLVAKSVSVED
jgi:hypothetical protein